MEMARPAAAVGHQDDSVRSVHLGPVCKAYSLPPAAGEHMSVKTWHTQSAKWELVAITEHWRRRKEFEREEAERAVEMLKARAIAEAARAGEVMRQRAERQGSPNSDKTEAQEGEAKRKVQQAQDAVEKCEALQAAREKTEAKKTKRPMKRPATTAPKRPKRR